MTQSIPPSIVREVAGPIKHQKLGYAFRFWEIVTAIFDHLALTSKSIPSYIGTQPPSIDEVITIKTETRTYNHINEYAINGGALWFRARGQKVEWKPLPFQLGIKPIYIDSDGANLMVVSDNGVVHFKKVLDEERIGVDYTYRDISDDNGWRDRWCVLPIISLAINLICEKMLKLPEGYRDCAISHRGRFIDHVTDGAQQKHVAHVGTTTLYVIDKSGRFIYSYDPWSPKWSRTEIYLPQTADTYFTAERIKASGSTIMVIGYETNIKTGAKTLKVYTRLADIDTDGGNPWFHYAYKGDPYTKETWVLPVDADWKEHPLPSGDFFGNITIVPTGQGNDERKMYLYAKNNKGVWGYFEKNLLETSWNFMAGKILGEQPLLKPDSEIGTTQTHNYFGVLLAKGPKAFVQLNNLGQGSLHSTLNLQLNKTAHKLDIYVRYCFKNFLGFEGRSYDLVIPQHPDLQEIFGEKHSIRVTINHSENGVKIAPHIFAEKSFNFSLVRA